MRFLSQIEKGVKELESEQTKLIQKIKAARTDAEQRQAVTDLKAVEDEIRRMEQYRRDHAERPFKGVD